MVGTLDRPSNPARAATLIGGLRQVPDALVERLVALESSGRSPDDDGQYQGGCSICFDPYLSDPTEASIPPPSDAVVVAMPCNHVYHRRCLKPWFET